MPILNRQERRSHRWSCFQPYIAFACKRRQSYPPRCKRHRFRISPQCLHGRFLRRLPNQKDNIACRRLIASVFPLSVTLKPICTVHAACEFWDNPAFDITTLVGTPRYEAGTPFHTPIKAIPTPIRLTALISELCQSDLHNRLVTAACERPPVWIIQQHMGGILRVAIAVPT